MKKLIFSLAFLFSVSVAYAQFHFGGNFSVNFSNELSSYNSGVSVNKEISYLVSLQPKLYWNFNEKMQAGGRIGFAFGRLATGLVETEGADSQTIVNRAVGWTLAPFFGYRLLNWKRVNVWAEANVIVGQFYNTDKKKAASKEWGTRTEYGFQILPVVNIDLTEKLALQLHLGFISLGWYGSRSEYADRIVTTSDWDLHKGGIAGLIQGFSDYGIGIVRTF